MSDITVRDLRFPFEEKFDLDVPDESLSLMLSSMALSMTMPYLEPYLIRTMGVAIPKLKNPKLAEDTRDFSRQEAHHYRNHANLNRRIRASFSARGADALGQIESALDVDYRRFSREKPLRWNLAYAEGFEAMTCSGALAMAEFKTFDDPYRNPGGEIWGWHLAEEIEHRTVAFGVFQELVGSYLYRLLFGSRAQHHYLSYIGRFARCMAEDLGRDVGRPRTPVERRAVRLFLRTLSPRYDPAKIEIPEHVSEMLAAFTERAEKKAS
ncbi:MAG: metal-dependent hydrolase [Myxococcota bacterium]|nr:metal-dependent hydrolase [Myxococcota bacterium]